MHCPALIAGPTCLQTSPNPNPHTSESRAPQAGRTYKFQVTAFVAEAPFTAATASVSVTVLHSPLRAGMQGGTARTVSAQDAITVMVSGSRMGLVLIGLACISRLSQPERTGSEACMAGEMAALCSGGLWVDACAEESPSWSAGMLSGLL